MLEGDTDSRTPTEPETATGDEEATPTETPTRRERLEDRFSTIVDVAEEGGDTTGEQPINRLVEENLADDTLFFFPEGTYHISGLLVVQHYSNVGFVGRDATLRPTDEQRGNWIIVDDVSDLLFERLTLSNVAEQTGVRTKIQVDGGTNVVRDVTVEGFQDIAERTHAFTLQVSGTDTSLVMNRVDMSDGAQNGTAVYVHPASDPGELRLEHCEVENWYEQGVYASPHGGPIYVLGGRYVNNGMAQVRVGGGGADTESVIRDVTVRITDPEPAGQKGNIRGIWLKEGEGTVVENCDIEVAVLSNYGSSGALVIGPEHGKATIRDTSIRVDDSTFALAATKPKEDDFVIPSLDRPPEHWDVTGEDLTVSGEAANDIGILVLERPGCTFRNVDIRQGGENRDGVGVFRSPGTTFEGISCVTTNYPLIANLGDTDTGCNVIVRDPRRLESSGLDTDGGAGNVLQADDDEYCLRTDDFDFGEERSGIGVTHRDDDGLHVRLLSERKLSPF